jgi:REP element-mobilizing transposase RayT
MSDQVHLLVTVDRQHSIYRLVTQITDRSSRLLRQ